MSDMQLDNKLDEVFAKLDKIVGHRDDALVHLTGELPIESQKEYECLFDLWGLMCMVKSVIHHEPIGTIDELNRSRYIIKYKHNLTDEDYNGAIEYVFSKLKSENIDEKELKYPTWIKSYNKRLNECYNKVKEFIQ